MDRTVDYVNFVSQISDKLAADGYFNPEWIDGQRKRLNIMWNAGETVESAHETLSVFAKAQLGKQNIKRLNPMSAPLCIKYTEV